MAKMITNRPARKVTASSLGSALSVVAVWALSEFGDIEMPVEVNLAFSALVTFLVGYFVPPSASDQVELQ